MPEQLDFVTLKQNRSSSGLGEAAELERGTTYIYGEKQKVETRWGLLPFTAPAPGAAVSCLAS